MELQTHEKYPICPHLSKQHFSLIILYKTNLNIIINVYKLIGTKTNFKQ